MKFSKLLAPAALAAMTLSACRCGAPDSNMLVTVTLDQTVTASCVVLEVAEEGGVVRLTQDLPRESSSRLSWRVALKQNDLPDAISLTAKGYQSASGTGCGSPRTLTSGSMTTSATFPVNGVQMVSLRVTAPNETLDGDKDGFVAKAFGGNDCNDANAEIRPNAPERCTTAMDFNCDGKVACDDPTCASAAVCNQVPAKLSFVTSPPALLLPGTCSPVVTAELRDASDQPVAASMDLLVSLSAIPPSGITFYSDPACTTAVTSRTLAFNTQRISFHVRAANPAVFSLTAALPGLTSATQQWTAGYPQVASLAFTTPARTVRAGECSQVLTVETRDASGQPAVVGSTSALTLESSAAGVTFFSDASCTTALSNGSASIAMGNSSASFYARPTLAGPTTLTARFSNVTPATQALTVNAGNAAKLAFTTGAQGVPSGACSGVVTVEVRDAFDNPVQVAATTTVSLSAMPQVGFSFHTDVSCAGAGVGSVDVSPGQSSASFRFRGTPAGPVTMTAAAAPLTAATQVATIGVGPVAALVFTTAPQTLPVGQCSGAVTVQTRDANGNPSNVSGSALVASLGAMPGAGFQFFSDMACTTAATAVSVNTGASTGTFFFRGTTAGAVLVTVTPGGTLSAISQSQTLQAGAASALTLTVPATVSANACSAADLRMRDGFGNDAPASSATAVTLSNNGAASLLFFSDSACANALSAGTTIAANSATHRFYFRDTVAGTRSVTATAPFGTDTKSVTVQAGAPAKLSVAPASRSSQAGACAQAATVTVLDAFDNPTAVGANTDVTFAFTADASFAIYDDNCVAASSTRTVSSGSNSLTFSFKGNVPSMVSVTLSATGLTGTSFSATVTPAPADRIVFTSAPQTAVPAGQCSQAVTVQTRDAFGNAVSVAMARPFTVSAAPSAGFAFFADSSCTTSLSAPEISANQSTATFYFRTDRAGPYVLTVAGSPLTGDTQNATVLAGPATALVFTTNPQLNVTAGNCSAAVTVERRDNLGNAAGGAAFNATLTGSAQPGFGFFSDSSCVNALTNLPFGAGSSTSTFYFRGTKTDVFQLNVSGGGLTAASQPAAIVPGPAAKLFFYGMPQTVAAGQCSGVLLLERRDANDNGVISEPALTVTLSAAQLSFFSDAACSNPLASSQTTIPNGQASVPLYFRGTVAGAYTVTASAASLQNATQGATITAATATKLVFIGGTAQTVDALTCSPAASLVQAQDVFNNPANPGSIKVLLSGTGERVATFHDTAACSPAGALTSVDLGGDGGTVAQFFFTAQDAGSLTVTAAHDDGGLGSVQTTHTIAPAPATSLSLATADGGTTFEAGACTPLVATRLDARGRPTAPAAGLAVTYGAFGASGATITPPQFFTDATCSTAGASGSIASGASSGTHYIFGVTAGSYAVNALAPSPPGNASMPNFTVLPMVRRGTCNFVNGEAIKSCPIAPAIPGGDISRTFLMFQAVSNAQTAVEQAMVTCRLVSLAGVASIACTRDQNNNAVTVSWQTASYGRPYSAGGASVEHLSFLGDTNTPNPVVQSPAVVTPLEETFTLFSHTVGHNGLRGDNFFATERLSDGGVLTRSATGAGTYPHQPNVWHHQLVVLAGAEVARGNLDNSAGASFSTNPAPTGPGGGGTFALYTASDDTADDNVCRYRFQVAVNASPPGQVDFSRSGGGNNSNCIDQPIAQLSYERVRLPAGHQVAQRPVTMVSGDLSALTALPSVDLTRTLTFMGGQGAGGQAGGDTTLETGYLGSVVATAVPQDDGGMTVTRGNTGQSATSRFNVFVWELKP